MSTPVMILSTAIHLRDTQDPRRKLWKFGTLTKLLLPARRHREDPRAKFGLSHKGSCFLRGCRYWGRRRLLLAFFGGFRPPHLIRRQLSICRVCLSAAFPWLLSASALRRLRQLVSLGGRWSSAASLHGAVSASSRDALVPPTHFGAGLGCTALVPEKLVCLSCCSVPESALVLWGAVVVFVDEPAWYWRSGWWWDAQIWLRHAGRREGSAGPWRQWRA